jgi:hypothetical protein
MEEIIQVKAFKRVKCITAMVAHVKVETEIEMKGTTDENEWYFYHDTLSHMTQHKTQ